MAFTFDDYQDFLRLLAQHPEWRADLRRHVLTDDLLELPALVRQLIEAQARTEERLEALAGQVEQLAEAQARTEQGLQALTQRVEALTVRFGQLAEAQLRTEERVAAITGRLDSLNTRVGSLEREVIELRYDRRGPAYFSKLARRLRVVDSGRLADLLDDAVEEGRLTEDERESVLLADLVLSGRRRGDQAEVYLLVEVSVTIDEHDVRRAADRADVLAKLGRPVLPAVAGKGINADAIGLARARSVWQVLDGQTIPPSVA